MTPIGVARTPFTATSQIPKGRGAEHHAEGAIEVLPHLEPGLTDIEGFSHLYVIWMFDRAGECELVGIPPTDTRPHGVFATRSPRRPNPIGLTVVRLLRREGTTLHVAGVDMLDGSPILDIKPYLSSVPADQLRRGWLDEQPAEPVPGHIAAAATGLVRTLDLQPHPEGGFFREVYRSASGVTPGDGRPVRAALTTIYFLLVAGEVSRWHRVRSDEVWHFYEGAPLRLMTLGPDLTDPRVHTIGPVAETGERVSAVPAEWWQAAETTGAYSLVGCTVGPGFDFADFALAADVPGAADAIRALGPAFARFL